LAAPFAPAESIPAPRFARFAFVADNFLPDCDPQVVESFRGVIGELQALGLEGRSIDADWWDNAAVQIFAPIQASEAAEIHAGNFDHFEPLIRDRLKWGASIKEPQIRVLRDLHAEFRARMDELFAEHEIILLPCAPVARLEAGADHSQTRPRLLRYTAPFSLAGVPALTIPCAAGGMQLAAARGFDEQLLGLGAQLGARRKALRIS
jgi:aspartyl-tRNA(Asn)/glutamyl-tRNA(Gln) amidotransferase subunit A